MLITGESIVYGASISDDQESGEVMDWQRREGENGTQKKAKTPTRTASQDCISLHAKSSLHPTVRAAGVPLAAELGRDFHLDIDIYIFLQ